ncbi:MAG: zf-HC2 domain-containing protein [Acidobacteriota bacterium]|nr:MAG: zf-HC2 domain-containing protein [Acidobacteriota bacterium]
MMTWHLTTDLLAKYRRRECTPEELLQLDDHLRACERCLADFSAHFEVTGGLLALTANLQTPETIDHPNLQTYLSGVLDEIDRELVESHLEFCAACRDQKSLLESRGRVRGRFAGYLGVAFDAIRSFDFPARWPALATGLAMLLLFGAVFWLKPWDRPEVASSRKSPSVETPQKSPVTPKVAEEPLLAITDNGVRIALTRSGDIEGLEQLSPRLLELLEPVIRTRTIGIPSAELSGKSAALMGDQPGTFRLISPVGRIVDSVRPVFRWQSMTGAAGYTVSIYDPEYREVAVSPVISETHWTPELNLRRGQTYLWQVTARLEDREVRAPAPNQPEAMFRVLDGYWAGRIAEARGNYPGSRLLLGSIYAKAGMIEEAERELRELVKSNPESDFARRLLDEVIEARRRK